MWIVARTMWIVARTNGMGTGRIGDATPGGVPVLTVSRSGPDLLFALAAPAGAADTTEDLALRASGGRSTVPYLEGPRGKGPGG